VRRVLGGEKVIWERNGGFCWKHSDENGAEVQMSLVAVGNGEKVVRFAEQVRLGGGVNTWDTLYNDERANHDAPRHRKERVLLNPEESQVGAGVGGYGDLLGKLGWQGKRGSDRGQ